MKRRPLTGRGWGCLLSGVLLMLAANIVSARPLLYLGVLLLALPLICLMIVRVPRRRGEVRRQISTDLLAVGETSRVQVRFDLWAFGVPNGIWHDTLPSAVRGEATGAYPQDALRYDLEGVRRGISTLGPLMLRTTDPFGLAQREQAFGDTRTITVIPQTVALDPLPTKVGAAGGTAQTRSTRIGQGADNLIPRPYAAGDSRRRIHWRATAHRGSLMVRQEEEEASPDAMVVLDRAADRWDRPGEEPDPLFESAVTLCASVALRLAQDGYSVDVVDSSGNALGALRGHEEDRDDLMIALAMVAPRGESHDLRSVVGSTPPGPLVLITGHLPDEDAEKLSTAGAASPLLFAAEASDDAIATVREHGWRPAQLPSSAVDLADTWASVLPFSTVSHV
ncbi:DUF58 domain-containing protein [Microbacterium arabinogalactanolyticum]|uniref:DUF58 domain-containing protein n=1 Tax=Microbacterium arabinogalactanolyticum TaxID=69365 RepID=UPI002552FE9A|nr:DUF58 domain-containing protein [Microbacterium arabinogalactanolyticum]GLC86044.1 membrane protein [Microbacterium arabinogalactanolyticum]